MSETLLDQLWAWAGGGRRAAEGAQAAAADDDSSGRRQAEQEASLGAVALLGWLFAATGGVSP